MDFHGGGTYLISVIAGNRFTLMGMVRWVFGFGTWLYYVPVILFCFILFRAFNAKGFLWLNVVVTLIGVTITTVNGMNSTGILTVYQNPLNWVGFFAIGILMKDKNLLILYSNVSKSIRLTVVTMSIIVGTIYYIIETTPSYCSWFSILFEILSFFALFEISCHLRQNQMLIGIGKSSYFIFFSHMQIGMYITNRLFYRFNYGSAFMSILYSIIKPVTIVLIMYFFVCMIKTILKKFKKENYLWIFGL